MRTFLVLLVCVCVALAQTPQEYEDQCECAMGPLGDMVPYPCNYLCPTGYRCHLTEGECPLGESCVPNPALTGQYMCQCTGTCTSCGQVVCGNTCLVGCAGNQQCVDEGAGYFCKLVCDPACTANQECVDEGAGAFCKDLIPPCTPTCVGKRCGETDGCGGRCDKGSCVDKKDTCGGGGIEFVCGRPKNGKGLGWAWGVIAGGLGCVGVCAGGVIYVKRRQRKALVPADLKESAKAADAPQEVEVVTDPGLGVAA